MNLHIDSVDTGRKSFVNSLDRLSDIQKGELILALKDLKRRPQPGRLKLEKLTGYKKPGIYTIHFTGNNSHKLSFELSGTTAILRRVGTHKLIDRNP